MKHLLILISAVGLLLIGGCSLHHVATPNPGELPAQYTEDDAHLSSTPDQAKWWEAFHSPHLSELIETALSNNLDIAQAAARLKQAEAVLQTTGAGRQPVLTFQGQKSRDHTPSLTGTTTSTNYRLSLSAAFELDLWQKFTSLSDAAQAEFLASGEAMKTLYISISAQTADLYFLISSLRAQSDSALKSIDLWNQNLEMVTNRYQHGLVPSSDVYQARQSLASAEIKVSELRGSLAKAEHSLAIILGEFPSSQSAAEVPMLPEIPAAFPAGLPADLLTHRPDLKAAQLKVIAQDERLGAAIADRLPAINLLATYGRTSTPLTDTFWTLLVGVTQPIFDGGRRKAEADRHRAAVEEALAFYRQTALQAVKDVEDSLAESREADNRLALTRNQHAIAAAILQLTEGNYQSGIIDLPAVFAARRNVLDMDKQLSESKRLLLSSRVSLARALGGGWADTVMKEKTE